MLTSFIKHSRAIPAMNQELFTLLVDKNEISWKSIIFELINSNKMNPWDIDISLLADTYIKRIHQLKEQDLKVSGKVVLAAAMLLRIKSNKLVGDNLDDFDRLLAGNDVSQGEFYDSLEAELAKGDAKGETEEFELLPRLPQGRKRKVSVYDLVKALEKALEVKQRRVFNHTPPSMVMPARKFDVTAAITNLFARIKSLFGKSTITFTDLVSGKTKQDKVYTIIPLLHLANHHQVELEQKEAFGEITVTAVEGAHVQ